MLLDEVKSRMSWRKMYQQNLPKLYQSVVNVYRKNNIQLNLPYPRSHELRTKEDYQYFNNIFLNALNFPEYHYLYRNKK